MAIEKTIKIKVDSGEAEKSLNKLEGKTKETSNAVGGLTGKLDSMTGGMITKFKGVVTSIKSVNGGFNAMKIAIIGTGIGALLIAIVAIITAFKNSEAGQNKFAKLMGVIGSITGNLVDILASLGEKIIWAFENPKQAIQDFVKLIKENIINRFNGLLELIPQMGKAIKQLFKGDFGGAAETAANAVAKVTLGTENLTKSIKDAGKALEQFGKEVAEDAKKAAEIADKRAKADKIDRQLILDRAIANNKIAKLRDIASRSDLYNLEQRKKALEEAGEINSKIANSEIASAKLRYDAIKLENTLSGSTKEDLDAEYTAKAKLIELDTAKLRLQKRLGTELAALNNQLAIKPQTFEEFSKRQDAIKKQIEDDAKERERINEENFNKNQDLQAYLDEQELIETDAEDRRIENAWKAAQEQKKIEEDLAAAKLAIRDANINNVATGFALLGQLAGKNKAVQAAALIGQAGVSIAQTVIKTQAANAIAIAEGAALAIPTAGASVIAATGLVSANNVSSALSIGLQAAALGQGLASLGKGGGGSANSVGGSVSGGGTSAPSFNLVAGTGSNQIAEGLQGQSQPIEAYVVSSNVTTSQELDRKIISGASLG